jgi:ferredoxin-type protein NapH
MAIKKWTIARRAVQIAMIALIATPLFGLAFFQGNLAAGSLFGFGLADPLAFLQAGLAGRIFVTSFLGSALFITIFYFLLGGRTFCSWICPVYLITELGEKLRSRLGTAGRVYPLKLIRWSFAFTLAVSSLTGVPIFEVVSPIGITTRAVMFNAFTPLALVVAIFITELFVACRIWCRSLCPVGGFYSLLGRFAPLRIGFEKALCTDCGECSRVCLVEEVLAPCLEYGERQVVSGDCTRCCACVDACASKALRLGVGYSKVTAGLHFENNQEV